MSTLRPAVPELRTVLAVTLGIQHDAVKTPEPLMEYGGLRPVPEGALVRLDIGDARRCFSQEAAKIAGALYTAAQIEIVGADIEGVTETRAALAAALARYHLPHAG